jgi:hypothetical protein
MMNANEGPKLGNLGIPDAAPSGKSKGAEDLSVTLQFEQLNKQLEDAKRIATAAGPHMAHPYLNAVLGIVAKAVDPEIAGPAFDAASKARMQPALDEYTEAVAGAKSIIDEGERRQKAFQNILASNPEALVPLAPQGDIEAQKQLGLATFGIPIPIDPGAKSRLKLADLQTQNFLKYQLTRIKEGNKDQVADAVNQIGDAMDPDGNWHTPITPKDLAMGSMDLVAKQKLSEVTSQYVEADQAARAWLKFQTDGDRDSYIASLGLLHTKPKTERASTRLETQLNLISRRSEYMRQTGETDPEKAMKAMGEEFQTTWEAVMPKGVLPGADEFSVEELARMDAQAHDDAIGTYRALGEYPDESELAMTQRNILLSRLKTARALKAQQNRANRKIIGHEQANAPAAAPKAAPIDMNKWRQETAQYAHSHDMDYSSASAARAAALKAKGREAEIPPDVRKQTGF